MANDNGRNNTASATLNRYYPKQITKLLNLCPARYILMHKAVILNT